MLRKIRLTFAILFFTVITLLFLDFTGTLHAWFGWMAKIQFLPALLALNVGVVLLLVVLTLLVGRVYCSVICPLGVFQDIVSWMSGTAEKEEVSLYVFSRSVGITLHRSGAVRHCPYCRNRFGSRAFGAIQLVRANCFQPFCSAVWMGKQWIRLFGRAGRQLRVL